MSEETPEYGMRSEDLTKKESEALMKARAVTRAIKERVDAMKQVLVYLERIGWNDAKRSFNVAELVAEFAVEYKNELLKPHSGPCVDCGENDWFSFKQEHLKCRKCKSQFTIDIKGDNEG